MLMMGIFLKEVLNLALQKGSKIMIAFGKAKMEEYSDRARNRHVTIV